MNSSQDENEDDYVAEGIEEPDSPLKKKIVIKKEDAGAEVVEEIEDEEVDEEQ